LNPILCCCLYTTYVGCDKNGDEAERTKDTSSWDFSQWRNISLKDELLSYYSGYAEGEYSSP
jgi:hypothetical protein